MPLDPTAPVARVVFALTETGALVVLTQAGSRRRIPPTSSRVVSLDAGWAAIAGLSDTPLATAVGHGHLAYVIYTSGSTGQPKGVEITHGGLSNLVGWHQRTYGVTHEDRATQIAGLAFDASVWELWPYLSAGASIHLADEEVSRDPARLWRWMADCGITMTFLPTPLAEAALRLPIPDGLALRALLTGGDRLTRGPSVPLPFDVINHYGPTENTVVSTCSPVSMAGPAEGAPPIGRPIDNVTAYVLDDHGEPVPIGVPGELFVGGASLARGYLKRPDLTADRFVPDRFSAEAGARLYRTGDLVRYLADGHLQFIGRIDHQVKIRGSESSSARSTPC